VGERTVKAGAVGEEEITRLLKQWHEGDSSALARVVTVLYGDLRRLAQHFMEGERPDHTLQATALVHEAVLQLPRSTWPHWQSRRHFLNSTARLMRRLLVDWARSRTTAKRGKDSPHVPLEEMVGKSPGSDSEIQGAKGRSVEGRAIEDIIALDVALDRLALVDERKAQVLELRYFGGLSLQEVAEQLGVSAPTVNLDARLGKAWLLRELGGGVTSEG